MNNYKFVSILYVAVALICAIASIRSCISGIFSGGNDITFIQWITLSVACLCFAGITKVILILQKE